MPKSTLTWYKTKANRIVKDMKLIPQQEIAILINKSQQVVSYRINNVYKHQFEDLILILDRCGYEIKEKEGSI